MAPEPSKVVKQTQPVRWPRPTPAPPAPNALRTACLSQPPAELQTFVDDLLDAPTPGPRDTIPDPPHDTTSKAPPEEADDDSLTDAVTAVFERPAEARPSPPDAFR